MLGSKRDPVSELLDRGARELLERAYGARGEWVLTRLADPDAGTIAWAATLGIDVMGRDNAPTASGRRNNAHTRWGRAFVRSLYHQHRWWSNGRGGWRVRAPRMTPSQRPLVIDWGNRVPKLGVIPAGRAIRVRAPVGGRPGAVRAIAPVQPERRIYTSAGHPGGRWADKAGRDWS
jgi:hypothetical protein